MANVSTRDTQWIKRAFIIPDKDTNDDDYKSRRYFSTASVKFVDSSLGGNTVINPVYSFTESADIPIPGPFNNTKNDPVMQGYGPYASEAYDDNMQQVHCRMGVAKHNSLTRFFGNLYDSDAGRLARTGRTFDPFFLLGRAAGFVVSIIFWPIMAIQLAAAGVRMLLGHPTTKFYYLKPTMPLYWNAVTYIVNQITVNKGIVPRVMSGSEISESQMGERRYGYTTEEMAQFNRILPDLFSEDGSINVYAVANRAQRLARRMNLRMEQAFQQDGADPLQAIKQVYDTVPDVPDAPPLLGRKEGSSSDNSQTYMGMYFNSGGGNASDTGRTGIADTNTTLGDKTAQAQEQPADQQPSAEIDAFAAAMIPADAGEYEVIPEPVIGSDGVETAESINRRESLFTRFGEFFAAELDHGGAFFSFRPDYAGPVSESFSNSFGQSEIQRKINDMSSEARSMRFNFADGNVAGVLNGVMDAVKAFASGVINQFNVQGLAVLAGNAFVDIPQTWESATASLPTASYTIRLGGPYGNAISQLMDIDIPLACFLAMALPRATGPQSYTSPFFLEYYDRGRSQSRLAAVSALSVQRGVGNLGFTQDWRALAVEVNITLMPLDSIVAMPITTGFTVNPSKIMFTEDTAFTDYLNVLSGMGMQDQLYAYNKWKLNLTRARSNFNTFFSAAHFASFASDLSFFPPTRLVGTILRGTGSFGFNGSIRN